MKMNKIEKEGNKKFQKSLKEKKGITLIALVITILIIIILASVTINFALGDNGLINMAELARDEAANSTDYESNARANLVGFMNEFIADLNGGSSGGGTEEPDAPDEQGKSEVEEAKERGEPFEDKTTIKDDLDNPVTVPGGFNIAEDSGTKVEEGIVIEDSIGNQFVWIPIGEYNVSPTINPTGKLTNELTRREWADENVEAEPIPVSGDSVIKGYCYGEGDSRSVAKDQIEAFKTSAITNKGFYIGRYEQGTANECKPGVNPYTGITRDEAKQKSEGMYSGNAYVTSELISSYAWDTALNFICQTNEEGYLLATTTNNNYGNLEGSEITKTGQYKVNGVESDKYSNIYDLLGNLEEWTTEYSSDVDSLYWLFCINRGKYAASRRYNFAAHGIALLGFRVQLYVK